MFLCINSFFILLGDKLIIRLSLKVISFLLFGAIAYKFLNLKESIKGILNYVIKPKESVS